ncbi:hypothetical protein IMSAG025_01736 [Muribaculaceae bacterium]|nr:hypothetical protein IMSAG025_01736 [Muribaculaceae bacterium]
MTENILILLFRYYPQAIGHLQKASEVFLSHIHCRNLYLFRRKVSTKLPHKSYQQCTLPRSGTTKNCHMSLHSRLMKKRKLALVLRIITSSKDKHRSFLPNPCLFILQF